MVLLGSVFVLIALVMPAPGQIVASQQDVPITLSITLAPNNQRFDLHLHNKSGKEIVAYVVKYETRDVSGRKGPTKAIKAVKTSNSLQPFAPGKAWTRRSLSYVYDKQGNQLAGEVSVDYVRFLDGSRWGADQLKMAAEIDGFLAGASAVRRHLKTALETEGQQAVQRELSDDSAARKPK